MHSFDINGLVVMIVPLVFAVTFHEVAHGWVAFRLGDPTAKYAGRLTLNPIKHMDMMGSFILPAMLFFLGAPVIFGYAKPVPVNYRRLRGPKGIMMVALAGAVANLTFAFGCAVLFRALLALAPTWTTVWGRVLLDLFQMLGFGVVINIVLAVFNMIPIPPLDGSRVLSALLPPRLGSLFSAVERFGMLILVVFLFTGMLNKVISYFVDPLLRLFLGNEGLAALFRFVV